MYVGSKVRELQRFKAQMLVIHFFQFPLKTVEEKLHFSNKVSH